MCCARSAGTSNNNRVSPTRGASSRSERQDGAAPPRQETPLSNNSRVSKSDGVLLLGLEMANNGCIAKRVTDVSPSGGDESELVVVPYMAPGDAWLIRPKGGVPTPLHVATAHNLMDGTRKSVPVFSIPTGAHQEVVRRSALLPASSGKHLCPHRAHCELCPWHHLSPEGAAAMKQKRAREMVSKRGGLGDDVDVILSPAVQDSSSPFSTARQFTFHFATSTAQQSQQISSATTVVGLHNSFNEVVPVPSCFVAPLSAKSIASAISAKLTVPAFLSSRLGSNLLAVTVIEAINGAVRVVVLVKSLSAIFEGEGDIDYELQRGTLSRPESTLVGAILSATVTCPQVIVDLQGTNKPQHNNNNSSKEAGGGSAVNSGSVRHLYPIPGQRPANAIVDAAGCISCSSLPIADGPSAARTNADDVVEFQAPSALLGLGKGKGLYRFHQGIAATISVAFAAVRDAVHAAVAGVGENRGGSLAGYEIIVLRGTSAPHLAATLADAAESFISAQRRHSHAKLEAEGGIDEGGGTLRPMSIIEFNTRFRKHELNKPTGGGCRVVMAVVTASTVKEDLHMLWRIAGLTYASNSSPSSVSLADRSSPGIDGFVLVCEDESAAKMLIGWVKDASEFGASTRRKGSRVVFSGTVVDVDRRSSAFTYVLSWSAN